MKLIVYSIFIIVLTLTSNVSAQQTQCDSILAAKLIDESTIIDKESAKQTNTYAACSMDYKEFGKSMGVKAEAKYLEIGGSGSYNETNYNKWKATNCSNSTADLSRDAFRYSAHKTFKDDIVATWADCINKLEGLNCWASPQFGDSIEANIRWKSDENDLPVIVKAPLEGGYVRNELANQLMAPGSKILKNTTKILINPTTPTSSVHAIISAQRKNTIAYSCSIYVPERTPKNLAVDKTQICSLQMGEIDFDGDKCADTYRIENRRMMVKFHKNDRYLQVQHNNPNYNAELGSWFSGDFNGDGLADLLHMVMKNTDGSRLDYNHIHFSDGNGGFNEPTRFDFPCAANFECDYNTSEGNWMIRDIDQDGKMDLEHNPKNPDGRKHCWFSLGGGDFILKGCPLL